MAVLRGAAGWIIRQAAAMQAAAGGRRWRACPPRWRRWRLRCCCEVWQGWQAVGAVQAGQGWRWCVVIVGGGLLPAWSSGAALAGLSFPVQAAGGAICCGCGALAWSSWQRRQRPARAGLLIRQAGQAAGLEDGQKKKARAGGAVCAAALAFGLRWRGGTAAPGRTRCRRWAVVVCFPVPVPGRCWRWHCSRRNGSSWQRSSVARPALAVLHPVRFCRLPEGSDSPLYRVVL